MGRRRHLGISERSVRGCFPDINEEIAEFIDYCAELSISASSREVYLKTAKQIEQMTGGLSPSHFVQFLFQQFAKRVKPATTRCSVSHYLWFAATIMKTPLDSDQIAYIDTMQRGYQNLWGGEVLAGIIPRGASPGEIEGDRLDAIVAQARSEQEDDIADGFIIMHGCCTRGRDITHVCAERVALSAATPVVFCERKTTIYAKASKGLLAHPVISEAAFERLSVLAARFEHEPHTRPWLPGWNQERANSVIQRAVAAPEFAALFPPMLRWSVHGIRHGKAVERRQEFERKLRAEGGWSQQIPATYLEVGREHKPPARGVASVPPGHGASRGRPATPRAVPAPEGSALSRVRHRRSQTPTRPRPVRAGAYPRPSAEQRLAARRAWGAGQQ